jgi:hypothetical protein
MAPDKNDRSPCNQVMNNYTMIALGSAYTGASILFLPHAYLISKNELGSILYKVYQRFTGSLSYEGY